MNLLQTIYSNEPDLLAEVNRQIAAGANVNKLTKYGESALRVAANNGRFDVVKALLEAGADESQLQWSPSFYQVAYGDLASLENSIAVHQDLDARDFWQRTPWLLALLVGDVEKAALLLALGADRTAVGRCGKVAMAYPIQADNAKMLSWLIEQGCDIEALDDFSDTPLISAAEAGATECVRVLVAAGADLSAQNQIPERAIQVASKLDIIKILVDHGDDINDINEEMHAQLIGAEFEGTLSVAKNAYLQARYPRFGKTNPEKVIEPFWLDMIKTGANAYMAKQHFNDDGNDANPAWCYDRFGRSTTLMDDGRIIEIAGEHEDFYDPDFWIYNDVTVFHANGDIDTYIYPEDVFPATDFHTATRVGEYLYIIGRLGYRGSRIYGHTPVYRLNINTFTIQAIATSGDNPGWIHRHKARLEDNRIYVTGGVIEVDDNTCIDNQQTYCLNLASASWQTL